MSLAEVKSKSRTAAPLDAVDIAVDKWRTFPASVIGDHGRACCRLARAWLSAMDCSLMNAGDSRSGPRWIRKRYEWGPSPWPIHWCEAVERKVLDCGALAALSREVLLERGVTCFPTQFVHQYTRDSAAHWDAHWQGEQAAVPHWIKDDMVYHEGCAIVMAGDEIKIWDPTPAWWVTPRQFEGYGSVLALRISTGTVQSPTSFRWGAHRIRANEWQKIEGAASGLQGPDAGERRIA